MNDVNTVYLIEKLSDFEDMIVEAGVTAERILPADIVARIHSIEYCKHITVTGKVLRWCVITMVNGFGITSPDPSCSVSVENDNEAVGKRVVLEAALDSIWKFEGYRLSEERYLIANGMDVKSQVEKLGSILEGEFGERVGSFVNQYVAGNYLK